MKPTNKPLGPRQLEALRYHCAGLTQRQTAVKMGITEKAVMKLRCEATKKLLGIGNGHPVALFIKAIQLGIVACPCSTQHSARNTFPRHD